jgi:hypothetical protein
MRLAVPRVLACRSKVANIFHLSPHADGLLSIEHQPCLEFFCPKFMGNHTLADPEALQRRDETPTLEEILGRHLSFGGATKGCSEEIRSLGCVFLSILSPNHFAITILRCPAEHS